MKRIITTLFAAVLLYAGKSSASDLVPEAGQLIAVARQINEKEISQKLKADLIERFEVYFATTIFEMKDDTGITYFATVTNGKKELILKAGRSKWFSLKEKNLSEASE